ncbi:MAG TPA: choice-of-anchor tandem repeat GloVer-containing protein [Bryobacteraceae bacterium]|nr:choice-of-anchor tandem repeat GloVer-containing protein [Bryobacteraceae bacterium]
MLVFAATASGQTFDSLASFSGANGAYPLSSLVEGVDGNFYGTTSEGGGFTCLQSPSGCGTVFKITPGGVLTTLYSFSGYADGGVPAGLTQGSDGNFYGTTNYGGSFLACTFGCGTIFKITPAGIFTTMYTFCSTGSCTDGSYPEASLTQGLSGDFYGTTLTGGANRDGTIFKVTPSGALSTVYNFCSSTGCTDGELPCSPLAQDKYGSFYGSSNGGGSYGLGTIFKISSTGALSTLYSYALPADRGSCPAAGLVQASNGYFYGTTIFGGTYGYGSVFKITPAGAYTTLYSFCAAAGCPDGAWPQSALIQATDGNLYGVTSGGGDGGLFQMTTSGVLTPYPLPLAGTDGADPMGGLLQATDGNLYGTTALGGASDDGVLFSFQMGLDPFIAMLPASAKLGATVRIIGDNLSSATQVTFNGTTATFSISSATQIIAKVPTGATTGKVEVATPGGTLASAAPFDVTPQLLSFAPASGKPGTGVAITGESLTQTQNVTFDGVAAKFTVVSDTKITTTVPSGASTGTITVYTSGGKAVSATDFTLK